MAGTLGIDTSTRAGGAAYLDPAGRLEAFELAEGSTHSRALLVRIEELLAAAGELPAGLERIAVAVGPGSFTGLRTGIALANGLGLALSRPVVGVPTLEAFAASAGRRPGSVVVLLDAYRGEVYAARFDLRGALPTRETEDAVLAPEEALRRLVRPGDLLVGDGVRRHEALVRELAPLAEVAAVGSAAPAVARIAAAGRGELDRQAVPRYLRSLDAVPARSAV